MSTIRAYRQRVGGGRVGNNGLAFRMTGSRSKYSGRIQNNRVAFQTMGCIQNDRVAFGVTGSGSYCLIGIFPIS